MRPADGPSAVDPGKMPESDTLAPRRRTLDGGNCAGWRRSPSGRIRWIAMSKTVAAGFQPRSTHFITVGSGAREAGELRAEDQGREGTVGGAKGTEDGGREWRGLTQRGPWKRPLFGLKRAGSPGRPKADAPGVRYGWGADISFAERKGARRSACRECRRCDPAHELRGKSLGHR